MTSRMAPDTDRQRPSKLGLLCNDFPLIVRSVLNTYGSLLDISLISADTHANYSLNVWADEWRFIKGGEILLRSEASPREQIGQLHQWLRGGRLTEIIISRDNRRIRLLFEKDAMIYINAEKFNEDAMDVFRDDAFLFRVSNGKIVEGDHA